MISVQQELCKAAYFLGLYHAQSGISPSFPTVTLLVEGIAQDVYAPENELQSYFFGYGAHLTALAEWVKDNDEESIVIHQGVKFNSATDFKNHLSKESTILCLNRSRALKNCIPDRRLAYYDGESSFTLEEVTIAASSYSAPVYKCPEDYVLQACQDCSEVFRTSSRNQYRFSCESCADSK